MQSTTGGGGTHRKQFSTVQANNEDAAIRWSFFPGSSYQLCSSQNISETGPMPSCGLRLKQPGLGMRDSQSTASPITTTNSCRADLLSECPASSHIVGFIEITVDWHMPITQHEVVQRSVIYRSLQYFVDNLRWKAKGHWLDWCNWFGRRRHINHCGAARWWNHRSDRQKTQSKCAAHCRTELLLFVVSCDCSVNEVHESYRPILTPYGLSLCPRPKVFVCITLWAALRATWIPHADLTVHTVHKPRPSFYSSCTTH